MAPPENMPYVGGGAFAHKGGIHVSAVMKEPKTYEHIEPEKVGNKRKILVSDQSGKSNVIYKAKELGIDLEGYGEGLRENFVQGMKYELNNNGLKEQAEELEKKERKRKEKNKFKDKLIVNEIPEKISNKKENKSNRSEIRKESDERI